MNFPNWTTSLTSVACRSTDIEYSPEGEEAGVDYKLAAREPKKKGAAAAGGEEDLVSSGTT